MKGALASLALLVIVAGCQHTRLVQSNLQRLDALSSGLKRVGSDSAAVAQDVSRLDVAMQMDATGLARQRALQLRQDALVLSSQAGQLGNRLRVLAARQSPGPVRTYMRLGVETLSAQWLEAQDLVRAARLVDADPLLMQGRDVSILRAIIAQASREAARAEADARAASALRRRSWRSFRYVPVRPTATPSP
jgi:hypothetical protein